MSTTLYFGDLRTGRVTDTLLATGASWQQQLNAAGQVDSVTVAAAEVRAKQLRSSCRAARSFIVADVDGVLQEGGPVWSRTWDAERRQLTLGAAGLWSLFDHRMVVPVLAAGQRVQDVSFSPTLSDLGGIARQLVNLATSHVGGSLPLVHSAAVPAGDRTETFNGWELANLGEELRQITRRQVAAPDVRFRPRWRPGTPLSVEWVMEVGTEARPQLSQDGDDWFLDASVARSPVLRLNTDEDGTVMGWRGWVTGNGMEANILIGRNDQAAAYAALGYPLLEVEESRSTVTEQATLDGYAEALVDRSARPVETWTAEVTARVGRDILAGDYCQVTPHPTDPWLGSPTGQWGPGEGQAYMRVKAKAGSLGNDRVKLTMYDVAGVVS